MKMCHSEIIKQIKELETKKDNILRKERDCRTFSYIDENTKIVPAYSYEKTRNLVDRLDDNIRKYKHALALANCTVVVSEFNVTIGEALVMLAQKQAKCRLLEEMALLQQKSPAVSYNGKMEITECNYDVETVSADYEALRLEIGKLQVAIDRANLTNTIELD